VLRVASVFRVERGKISFFDTRFDAGQFSLFVIDNPLAYPPAR
jgi:hypothetical protein